jgi:hypothetical protein
MLPTNKSNYSSTSNPHRLSHHRPRVVHNGQQGAGGETPLSEMQRRGIRSAVARSPAVAVAPRVRAHTPPPGPCSGPSWRCFCPPLPPTRTEPRLPCLVPSGLDTRPPHPCQEFREPPCPPPRLPMTGTTTSTTSEASTPQWTCCWRTTGGRPPSPRHRPPRRPEWGGGAEYSAL